MAPSNALTKLPAIRYKMAFEKSDMDKALLSQTFDDDTKKKKYVPIFDGTGGMEALLYVEEQFRKAAAKLDYKNDDLFEYFEECLEGTAEDNWSTIESLY